MTERLGSTHIEGLGTYQYDQAVYDYLMQHGQRTRASLVTEVIERTGDDHNGDGYRTLVRKLRKGDLAAMVAEWETATQETEAYLAGKTMLGEYMPPPTPGYPCLLWLDTTAVGRERLAEHLRAGLSMGNDELRGYVESFVRSLEGCKKSCPHSSTRRDGPYTVPMPKGDHRYYMVMCNDCGAWLRNEDA